MSYRAWGVRGRHPAPREPTMISMTFTTETRD
ncbi:hypothetical protein ABIF83_004544 [Bradyrhizobium ottawaense]